MDLFEWQKLVYLMIVVYCSRFMEIMQLDRTTAKAVIQHCKNIFLIHGIPKEVVTNMGHNLAQMHSVSSRKSISFTTKPAAYIIPVVMDRLNEG